MNYTLLYLKYVLVVLFVLVMLATFTTGAAAVLIGVLGTLLEFSIEYLVLIPIGVFLGFMGFISLDGVIYITDKWKWKI